MTTPSSQASAGPADLLIEARRVRKSYGAVQALVGVDFTLAPGEIVGLVGHNGAGKSTLMNVLAGMVRRTEGNFTYDGRPVDEWGAADAKAGGLRCVFQELSLCANLSAAENTRIVHRALRGFGWRKRARTMIGGALDEIFEGHGIDPDTKVGALSIGERQMVEIARAFTETEARVRCVILDEPTSALGHRPAKQLLSHIRKASARGIACILITHRLNEILDVCGRVVVMMDGAVVGDQPAKGLTRSDIVGMMGSIEAPGEREGRAPRDDDRPLVIDHAGRDAADSPIRATAGEVIGFAGLDGHGQRERLRAIYGATRHVAVAFVAGDRGTEGLLPLWSIADNLTIRSLNTLQKAGFVSPSAARALAEKWSRRLKVRAPSIDTPVLSLSGGNQQKVLFARALASDGDVILLDDPMRGVDVGTKQEVYQLIRSEAERGRTFIWYTTEFEELKNCDRLYVFREGRAIDEVSGTELDHNRLLEASFGGADG